MADARRMRGEGSVFELRPGQWVGEVDLGYRAGKRIRKRVYGKTQDAVIKKISRLKRERDTGVLAAETVTVTAWLDYWLTHIAAERIKPGTLRTYQSYVEEYLKPVLGKRKLAKLEQEHVREFHAHMRTRTRRYGATKGQPISATTIRNAHRVLATALTDAMREGKLSRNVATLVGAPRKAAGTRTGMTLTEVNAVLTCARNDPLYARWLAAFVTGARQGELLGLRWDYVNDGVIDLAWSLQRIPYRHGCTKPCGKKRAASCPQRRVVIPAGVEHEPVDGNRYLLRPKTSGSIRRVPMIPPLAEAVAALPRRGPFVFSDADGRALDSREDYQAWVALLGRAQVRRRTLHEARHTTATLLLELGVDSKISQQILGHSDVLTTALYQTVSIDLAREALNRLGDRLAIDA